MVRNQEKSVRRGVILGEDSQVRFFRQLDQGNPSNNLLMANESLYNGAFDSLKIDYSSKRCFVESRKNTNKVEGAEQNKKREQMQNFENFNKRIHKSKIRIQKSKKQKNAKSKREGPIRVGNPAKREQTRGYQVEISQLYREIDK